MSTIIQIKRNSGTTAPTTSDLVVGEMAYAYDASNDGAGAKLYIEAVNNSAAADIHVIGGKYFTDLLDHTKGTLTASSAIVTDSSSKIDVINVDNVTINGNDISSTDSNGNLTLTPNGTGIVSINKNDGFKLPVGTTAQRSGSPVQGQIRYNTTLSSFEGYSGSAWGSLGGTIDVDGDTKITTEESAGSDEDQIKFFTAGTAQVIIKDGSFEPITDNDVDLGASGKEFKDLFIDGTANIDTLSADSATLGATSFGDNDITNVGDIQLDSISGDADSNTSITFSGSDVITVSAGGETQVTFNNGSILPTTDNDVDLGSSSAEFKDLHLDGTANIDSLVADTADINAGSIDGVTIGTNSVVTDLRVDNLKLDGNTLSSTDSNGSVEISPNGTGDVNVNSDKLVLLAAASEDATVQIQGGEGGNAILKLISDDSDDNGDDWAIKNTASNNGLTIESDISGSSVAQITLTPHATVASSTVAIAGGLTVAGATAFSGAFDFTSQAMTEVNIDGGAIDGVTIGTNSAVTDLRVDNLKLDGNDISSTDSNGNVTITPNGTGDVVVNSDQVIISGGEGETATLMFRADEGDDNGDDWTISNSTGNVLSINNDISGSAVAHVQFTPNATVANSTAAFAGDVTIAGDLTVSGDTTTVSSTNTVVSDKLVELANGTSGTPSGDVGHVFERGSSANIFVGFDESADQFIAASGTFTGATTGDLTIAAYVDAHFKELTLETDLTVANGGTGVSSFTDNGIVYGDGSNALDVTAAAGSSDATTSNQILTVDGSGVPVFTTSIDGGTY